MVESYPGTTCKSVGGVGTHEVFKGRAEGTTDRRTHELSSPNFEHGSFRKQGGARGGFAEPEEELGSGSIVLT